MAGFLKRLFGGKGIIIPGADKLLEGEGRKVDIGDPAAGGTQVLLVRLEGKVYALDTLCPHNEGGRLVPGPLMDSKYALCPLHNYRFDPRNGATVGNSCKSARTYKVKEANGEIELFL
ncbi:MAG: nitrite reductase/ring-hydroxylating ferredoxin subunit [Planctomycetota bacterium]|jgi:nitrite reductase/ring-hydroxylating ferredoxin subunit